MTSRAMLYAHAVRNAVGRTLGASWAYTAAQTAVAQTIYATWMSVPGCTPMIAAGWVADSDRELSLIPTLVGDHGMAKGLCQWWPARRAAIEKATGIDVATAPVADQVHGCIWEATKGPYKRVWPLLLAATTDTEVNSILIADFEQSADHAKDLARQLPMARFWLPKLSTLAVA